MMFSRATLLKRLLLCFMLLGLVACTDPWDRIQGEPSEEGTVQTETHEGDH